VVENERVHEGRRERGSVWAATMDDMNTPFLLPLISCGATAWMYVQVQISRRMTRRSLKVLEIEQCGLQSEITKSKDRERTCTMALFESYDQPLSSG